MTAPAAPSVRAGKGPARRRLVVVAGILLPALVLFVVVSDLFGWAYLRVPAQALLTRFLDRPVALGEPFDIRLRPVVRVTLGSVRIAAPDWSDEPHFAELENLKVHLNWRFLLGRSDRIDRVDLDRGDLRAVRTADGRMTWAFGPSDRASRTGQSGGVPLIGRLRIGALQAKIDDRQNAIELQVKARTAEDGTALIATGAGRWNGNRAGFDLEAPGVADGWDRTALAGVKLNANLKSSTLRFDGSIDDLASLDELSGDVRLAGDSLGELSQLPGLALPDTAPFRVNGRMTRRGPSIRVAVAEAVVGSSELTGQFDLDESQDPPLLTGHLDAAKLKLQDLGRSLGATGKNDAPGKNGAPGKRGRILSDEPFDLSVLRRMNADLAIDLRQLDLGTEMLRPLESVKARLQLRDGLLTLSDLRSRLAGGTVTGTARFDGSGGSADSPGWASRLDWRQVDLRHWLRTGETFLMAGRFNGRSVLNGSGRSTAAILGSLTGSIKGQVVGGSISHLVLELVGLDVAQSIGVLFKGSRPLALNCGLVDIAARQGQVRSNAFLLDTSDTFLVLEGGLSLSKEVLSLRLVPIPKDWSLLSLRTPIAIGGTFANPALRPEAGPLAIKLLGSVLLSAVAPIAALIPLIELGADMDTGGGGCAAALEVARKRSAAADRERAAEKDRAARPAAKDRPRPGRLPGERP